MRLLTAKAKNFGSYQELEFDFSSQGLALISGPTGSGKSTLQDLVPWLLFGRTAKDGNADDIRSWTSTEPTTGVLHLEVGTQTIAVYRTRGTSQQNDLYFTVGDLQEMRGKDITETQKLLDAYLGIDYTSFVIGSYYNEFSPTANFFTAKASDRRELFENLANLDLPVTLIERIADAKKETRKTLTQVTESLNREQGKLEAARTQEARIKRNAESWGQNQARKIQDLEIKSSQFEKEVERDYQVNQDRLVAFEQNKAAKIDARRQEKLAALEQFDLDKTCPNCSHVREVDHKERAQLISRCDVWIAREETAVNPYLNFSPKSNHYLEAIEQAKSETNPFLSQKDTIICDIVTLASHIKELQNQVDSLNHRANSLTQLHKIADKLREELRKNTIKLIESDTNQYLEAYFDAEIKVAFSAEGADKLDVEVWKSGHECAYRQLSKGQRGLLKLAFAVACMKAVSNKTGVTFNTLMFDEPAEGSDTELKLKSFRLFDSLSTHYDSVLIIDHNESIKGCFIKQYCVKINSDISTIEEII